MAALAYYAADLDSDLEHAEQLARQAMATRRDTDPTGEPPTFAAEYAMWFATMFRGDLDGALGWVKRLAERGLALHRPSDCTVGLAGQGFVLAYQGRFDDAMEPLEQLDKLLGPDPDPSSAWFLHFAQGNVWAGRDPERAIRYFEQATEAATRSGQPMIAHISNRDALAVRMGSLPPAEAAATARGVIEGLWDARETNNLRIAIPHVLVICVRANRWHEAALMDGLLGDEAPPLLPQHAARFQDARRAVDATLKGEAAALRSRSAEWSQTTAVEFILTTLISIAETAAPYPTPIVTQ